jgi:DNA polymerase III subunit alpha
MFASAAKDYGVQPIIGALLGVAREEGGPIDYLPLFSQDEAGWLNLCHLVSRAHLDRPLELEPHVALADLAGRTDGLIALSGGAEGGVTRLCAAGKVDRADELTRHLATLFPGRFYIEVTRRGNEVEDAAEVSLVDLAYALDLPLVATNPANFADPHMHPAHDAMLCIANSTQLDSADRPRSSP